MPEPEMIAVTDSLRYEFDPETKGWRDASTYRMVPKPPEPEPARDADGGELVVGAYYWV